MSARSASAGQRWLAHPSGLVGAVLLGLLLLFAALGPLLSPHDPVRVDLASRHLRISPDHVFGTDHLGRDTLARTAAGARLSLLIALLVTLVAVSFGTLVGVTAGYLGGFIDSLLMRIVDTVLAVPGLLLALALAGVLGAGLHQAVLAITLTAWAAPARLIRGQAAALRHRLSIEAALAGGARTGAVLRRHILPGVASTLTVVATLEAGSVILALGALSFLGLGAAPPTAEWGRMLLEAKPYLADFPLQMLAPGLALALSVLAFQLMGDAAREWLDPQAPNRGSD